ncbi:MAG: histidine kinase [Phormidesmis sp. CAN_BIN36]|nr:histidine kinase [Phormidesmis sp. CAN_BIN36]
MTSLFAPEISLYELAANSEQTPFALQVSPTTFKSMVGNLIDLLVEQQLPAVVWAKMPRGEAWQTALDRYCKLTDLPQAIYLLKNLPEGSCDSVQPHEQGDYDLANYPLITSISLAPESQLRREYFLLVWSEQFCCLLMAHRSKSSQTTIEPLVLESGPEDAHEKKQSLSVLLSLDQKMIQQFLGQLNRELPLADASKCEIQAPWATLIDQQPLPLDARLIGQIFTKQIQRQEELWQRSTTYRKQAELASLLQMQNEELLTAIRLKDEFLNNVGQELRTPLTNMKTALTLLNSPNLKAPQKQRYMDLLVKECDRQSALITSLLDLVSLDQRAEPATIQSLRLSDVVPGVVSTYQPLAEEKGVRLAYTVPEGLPPVACLSMWLKQIVINLLHNAVKFTSTGGQVWVRAKQQGDYVQLEFRDSGIGIAPSEIPKIFDRFYRVRQTIEADTGGSGLGLTIVQQLLLHCGGSISVKSRIGEGSVFNVLLPIYQKQVEKEEI